MAGIVLNKPWLSPIAVVIFVAAPEFVIGQTKNDLPWLPAPKPCAISAQ